MRRSSTCDKSASTIWPSRYRLSSSRSCVLISNSLLLQAWCGSRRHSPSNQNVYLPQAVSSNRLMQAICNAFLERSANTTSTYAQCIDGDPQVFSKSFSVIYLCLFFILVVLNQQRTVFQGKFLHAPFEAFRLFFNVFVVTWGWREVRHRLSAAILKMNLIRHAVEVPAGITNK